MIVLGIVLAATTLSGLVLAKDWLGLSDAGATTVSFITLGLSKVWFPFNLRDPVSPFWRNEITRNGWVWAALLLCLGLLAAAVYLPPLGGLLQTVPLDPGTLFLVFILSVLPLIFAQVALALLKRRRLSR